MCRINVSEIPDSIMVCGCRMLDEAVRKYFAQPGVKEDYEKWKAERQKGQANETGKNITRACGGDRTAE
ncbi:MAG: hypothetical protein IKN17_06160 [Ruminococcus sp.]|nr:hypothetical protein [Ruminococcus sp.]